MENKAKIEYCAMLKSGFFGEFFPQLSGVWEKDEKEWMEVYREMEENRAKRNETKEN
jgi:hypothetical protein